jgi:phosphoinositide-3-kinase regulatory subunit 4
MGQGYSVTTPPVGVAGIDVPELADLSYESSLGTARFMKSIRARHKDCLAVVKVVLKPSPGMKLDAQVNKIRENLHSRFKKKTKRHRTDQRLGERKALLDVPNSLPYQQILENATTAFLVRQYLYSSLYDRLR